FVRVLAEATLRIVDANLLKQEERTLQGCRVGCPVVAAVDLCQLAANGLDGVERGHWVLEDHGDPIATKGSYAARQIVLELFSIETQARGTPNGMLRQQGHEG